MTRIDGFEDCEHWIVKIGSAVFLDENHRLDRRTFADLIYDLAQLKRRGHRITIVSSGAVALGRERLGWPQPQRTDIPYLQSLAALGQSRLISLYEDEFRHYELGVSQILFTRGDLSNRRRFLNARMALAELHQQGVIPIINENDTVATEELKFGDNDELAGMTCGVVDADLLVMLSTVDGIFEVEKSTGDEPVLGRRISTRSAHSAELDKMVVSTKSDVGSGGMQSKIDAARRAARLGIDTVIANGKVEMRLESVLGGEDIGTYLRADNSARKLRGKKKWLGIGAKPIGTIVCDDGAVRAVKQTGASLLPSGVEKVQGSFSEGDVVDLVDTDNNSFARGLALYDAEEIDKIKGKQSSEIENLLGYKILDSVIHRDTLVLL